MGAREGAAPWLARATTGSAPARAVAVMNADVPYRGSRLAWLTRSPVSSASHV